MRETTRFRPLTKLLNTAGWFVKISDKYNSGIIDVLGCFEGKFVAIEYKIDYNKPTASQRLTLVDIANKGGASFVIWYKNRHKHYEIYCINNGNTQTVQTANEVKQWILKLSLSLTR